MDFQLITSKEERNVGMLGYEDVSLSALKDEHDFGWLRKPEMQGQRKRLTFGNVRWSSVQTRCQSIGLKGGILESRIALW